MNAKTSSHSLNIVVLISGNGTNLQAIIDAKAMGLAIEIRTVISNESDAFGIERAKQADIPTHIIPHRDFSSRDEFDLALRQTIDRYQPDLVVLAGFMRRLGSAFIAHYSGKMINIHPSLLPKHRGLDTHNKVLTAKDNIHGTTIHFVTDDLDGGPIIAQASIPVFVDDTEDSLKNRVQKVEHLIYPQVIEWFSEGRVKLHGDQVEFDGKLLPPTGILLKTEQMKPKYL